jgi:asparagine synthase (glutamine-hydrolysing)
MCGIAGIIQTDSPFYSKEHLKKMTDSLVHRGPEGEACWQNNSGKVLLGHRRLCIIDLSDAAAQPFHYMNRYTIIHNGEIYNYIELRDDLKKKGYSFTSASDTEVIAAAYDHYSDECIEYFDGMFAFAIWDEQEQELFAARDRFGEKPFYYSFNDNHLVFASEIKALWAAGIERKLNLQMLFNFITIGYTDNPGHPAETFYCNIHKLPAASTLYYSTEEKELTIEKYWDIDLASTQTITDKEAEDKFCHLLQRSVRRRLRSDVAIGTSLSGGLDSSSIVSIASLFNNERPDPGSDFNSFTAIFPGFEKDESESALKVASKFGLRPHTVAVTVDDFVNDWERFVYFQEEPFGSASAYAQYKVYELAKKHGVKVLLDGQGADETLGGYTRYYKWYWQELFQSRRLIRSKELSQAREIGVNEPFNYKNVIAALFPDIATVILERQYLVNALRQEDLTRDFVRMQSKEAYYSAPSSFDLNGALYFNTCVHGLEELLRLADRNAMAHGREARLPFLNHELVEFLFTLPSNFKIRKGWTKWLLRQAMDSHLPNEITWRKDKIGFEPPQNEWMKDPRVMDMIRESQKKLVDAKILQPHILNKPIRNVSAHDPEPFDWRYLSAAAYL